ncbi:MAG: hypothetical protein PW788_03030 [Micavibrio sp.]|nr:hypothetical protein [Micavibrio sp.]
MSKITDAQAALATMKATFEANNKYVVAGTTDIVFTNISKSVSDDAAFTALKARRTSAAIQIAQTKNNTSIDDNTKLKKNATTRVNFDRDAVNAIQTTIVNGTTTAVSALSGLNSLSGEILSSVQDYIKGATQGTPDATADNQFAGNAQATINTIRRLITTQQGKLADEHIIFSLDLSQAKKALDAAEAAIKTIRAGLTAVTPASDTSTTTDTSATDATGSTAAANTDDDSSVPVSTTTGNSLDVTA